jgi:Rrf2 family protein
MFLTRPAEYALRALTYLASRPNGATIMAREVASATAVPPHYLAKILQHLARAGLLESVKGPAGGFRLAEGAAGLSLLQVLDAAAPGESRPGCPAGIEPCDARALCGFHDSWEARRRGIVEYLQGMSLADAGASLARKRQSADRRKTRSARGKRPRG